MPYLQVAAQMVLLGGGLGLATAPATDSIMTVVRPDQAGAGSAVNDATRQVGGTLGVAVLGSISSTLYTAHLHDTAAVLNQLSPAVRALTREGLAQGLAVARSAHVAVGQPLRTVVENGFLDGLHAGCLTASVACLVAAAAVAVFLPSHPRSAAGTGQ